MIDAVLFSSFIQLPAPHGVEQVFSRAHGWSIDEVEPGRIRLKRGSLEVTHDGTPYTLVFQTEPPEVPPPPSTKPEMAPPPPKRGPRRKS